MYQAARSFGGTSSGHEPGFPGISPSNLFVSDGAGSIAKSRGGCGFRFDG
jgi:hypothetical protein